MTDLLNLPCWNVLKVQETDLNYVIDAAYEIEPAGCPHCGFMIRYGHGTDEMDRQKGVDGDKSEVS